MIPRPGLFVSFEGSEGTGKTTQITQLAAYLRQRNFTVCVTREPGGSPGAEAIRALLLTGAVKKWDGVTELLLLNAARRDHYQKVIKPAVEAGKIVISDRFADSTRAYQGAGHGLASSLIENIHTSAVDGVEPDLTFLLTMTVSQSIQRALARGGNEDRYEKMGQDFHEKVQWQFLQLAQKFPERIRIVPADAAQATVSATIRAIINRFISEAT